MPPPRLRYQTLEFGALDIHLKTLRDLQQFSDDSGQAEALGIGSANWSLFGVVWQAGEALARLMADFELEGRRVLEVGCGIGVPSLVLSQREANVTATDQHPEAGAFLRANIALNGGRPIPFVRTRWTDVDNELEQYDLVIGSDLLYERDQAKTLATFINRHAQAECEVIIADPGRPHCGRFTGNMIELGFEHYLHKPRSTHTGPAFEVRFLHFQRRMG